MRFCSDDFEVAILDSDGTGIAVSSSTIESLEFLKIFGKWSHWASIE